MFYDLCIAISVCCAVALWWRGVQMAVVGKVLLYIFVDYVSPFLFFGVGLVVFCVCGLFLGVFIQMFTAVSFR